MAEPLKVALVGYGYAGNTFHAPLIDAAPGLILDTIVTSRPQTARSDFPNVRTESSLSAICSDANIDLVVIATPNDLHADQAIDALQSGKHVVIDKPFAINLEDATRVVKVAKAEQRTLSVFHNRRWDSDFHAVKHTFECGDLGEISLFISRMDRYRPAIRQRWREGDGPGAGLWWDLGPHLLDMALVLFGEMDTISADIATQRPNGVSDDFFHIVLTKGDTRIHLQASLLTPQPGPRFEIHGSRGTLIKSTGDTQEAHLKAGMSPLASGFGDDEVPAVFIGPDGSASDVPAPAGTYVSYYKELAQAIQQGTPPPVTAEEALRVMKLLALARQSADEGRRIDLRSERQNPAAG